VSYSAPASSVLLQFILIAKFIRDAM